LRGHFELNTMIPLMAYNIISSIEWMAKAVHAFTDRCIVDIEADEARCNETVERNLALATALAPVIGYDKAAEISQEAYRSVRTVREIALEWKVLPPEELDTLLDPYKMTEPDE
jgi:fumarate hydratase class II